MLKIGLPEQWVTLAMEIVKTTTYSMLINGEPNGFITPTRGIRQGNHLSPYLFLLYAKGLSSLIRKATDTNRLKGIFSSRGGVRISHLLFADDSLLFCEAKIGECRQLLDIHTQYEEASRQAINRAKTTLFFSQNRNQREKEAIQNLMGAQVMTNCEKYLVLPMVGGKSKVSTFKGLQERITKKVMGWKEKTISKVGRETLIKLVAQAIPTYSMSIFKIPKSVCEDINSVLAKYWWGHTKSEKKIHWINWKRLCTQKNRGGMGFRDIHAFNLAVLAKQAWRLVTKSHSLFYRVYKTRYFPRCSFMDAELSHNPSFVWHSLLAATDVIQEGSMLKIGDGQSIKLTCNNWLQHPPLFKLGADTTLKVGDLLHHKSMQWNRPLIQATFMQATQNDILRIHLSNTRTRDKLYWKENKAQRFTVKTAYHVTLRLHREVGVEHSTVGEEKRFWNRIWKMNVPPKVRNFVWRACNDILPTRANLYRKKVYTDPLCAICE